MGIYMQALRQFHKVKNHTLTIQLPIDFSAEEVEVIILKKATEAELSEPDPVHIAIQRFLALDTSNLTADEQQGLRTH